jgi:hypothetical protein
MIQFFLTTALSFQANVVTANAAVERGYVAYLGGGDGTFLPSLWESAH